MELACHEPVVGGQFDHLDEVVAIAAPGYRHAVFHKRRDVGVIDLVAVPVALQDGRFTVHGTRKARPIEEASLLAESHGAAETLVAIALLGLAGEIMPFGHQADDGVLGFRVYLGRMRAPEADDVAVTYHSMAEAAERVRAASERLKQLGVSLG